jgi:hypothetical protein
MTAQGPSHTPGPWDFHLGRGTNPRLHIQTSGGYQIVSTPELSRHDRERSGQEANARLIAAAPSLLEALKDTVRALNQHLTDEAKAAGVDVETLCPCLTNEVRAAQAAIAKAEGHRG